jgi:hypothetical protein
MQTGGMNQNNSSGVESDQRPGGEDAAARWRKVIEQQRQSDLSVSAYCRQRGVSAASFFAWRRRLGDEAGVGGFKPVKLVSDGRGQSERGDGVIELRLRGGRRLRVRHGFDRGMLVELVETLEALA